MLSLTTKENVWKNYRLPGKHVEPILTCSLFTKEIHGREEFEPQSTNIESNHHSKCIIHSIYYSMLLNEGQSERSGIKSLTQYQIALHLSLFPHVIFMRKGKSDKLAKFRHSMPKMQRILACQ